MKKYAELRRERLDRLYPKYREMIESLETLYVNTSSVHYSPPSPIMGKRFTDTDIEASIRISMELTPELVVFLSDYMWFTGVPLKATENEGSTYISILESNK